jgi:hypothetical protein
MSLENILCPAQQINAVVTLICEDSSKRVDNDVLYALYSIMDNASRILKSVDDCYEDDKIMGEILSELGVYEEYYKRWCKRKKIGEAKK